MTQRDIARRVGIGRKTVRRFLHAGVFPERAQPPCRRTILDPFEPYLRERWEAGCHNSLHRWREIHERGFPGAASLVRRFVAAWRGNAGRRGPPPRTAAVTTVGSPPPDTPFRVPSPRQARWLLLRPSDRLRPEERTYRETLLQLDSQISTAQALAEGFSRLVRERDHAALAPWLKQATASGLPEFHAFATVLERDRTAVEAALTSEFRVVKHSVSNLLPYGRYILTPMATASDGLSTTRRFVREADKDEEITPSSTVHARLSVQS
jgi:transposase